MSYHKILYQSYCDEYKTVSDEKLKDDCDRVNDENGNQLIDDWNFYYAYKSIGNKDLIWVDSEVCDYLNYELFTDLIDWDKRDDSDLDPDAARYIRGVLPNTGVINGYKVYRVYDFGGGDGLYLDKRIINNPPKGFVFNKIGIDIPYMEV